ncbi:MAG: hypothetical protein ACPGVN_10020 [Alphaproteobacteria bacterium]
MSRRSYCLHRRRVEAVRIVIDDAFKREKGTGTKNIIAKASEAVKDYCPIAIMDALEEMSPRLHVEQSKPTGNE